MKDAMLTELYRRAFKHKAIAESLNVEGSDDRRRQVELALCSQVDELIDIRTEQIKHLAD